MDVVSGILTGLLLVTGGMDVSAFVDANPQKVAVPIVQLGDTKWVTIDAAFSYNDFQNNYVFLLSGNSVQVLKDRVGQYVMDRSNLNVPQKLDVTAAFVKDVISNRTVYYGRNKIVSVKGKKLRRADYGAIRKMLFDAPDAAGRKGLDVYLFKRCTMMKRAFMSYWIKASALTVTEMPTGLPCNVDAAWSEPPALILLKGDEFWRWEEDESINGPHPFSDTYQLTDNWALSPYTDGDE